MIGGGPAGMMAAGRAAELGARVALVEKNGSLGRKLLLTGNGRCNLTQAELDLPSLIEKYGKSGKFLFPALHLFGPGQVMEFFEARGLKLKVEKGGKVFPKSDNARDVLAVLLKYLSAGGVKIISECEVFRVQSISGRTDSLITGQGKISAQKFVLATGGKSYPQTGSDGAGFRFLKEFGHSITKLRPALAPIRLKEKWVAGLEGISPENVGLSAWQGNKRVAGSSGGLMFTRLGLSGPAALDLSGRVGELLEKGGVRLEIDFLPGVSAAELEKKMLSIFRAGQNKLVRNVIGCFVPSRLAELVLGLAGIDGDKRVNIVSREEREELVELLKKFGVTVSGLTGFERAMVTSGGVSLKEIDPNTMNSRLVENLFLAGEIIDLNGPSGGYNLQLCWSTGYMAGNSAAAQ